MDLYRKGKHIGSITLGRFYKFGVDEKLHLLHSRGSVPCLDADVWDAYKENVKEIYVRTTKGRTFKVQADVFERHKEAIDFGHGRQYTLGREYWAVESDNPTMQMTL